MNLVELTVLLTEETFGHLQDRAQRTRTSVADSIEHSVGVATFIDEQRQRGATLLLGIDDVYRPLIFPEQP